MNAITNFRSTEVGSTPLSVSTDGLLVHASRGTERLISEYWPITCIAISPISYAFAKDFITKPALNETDWQLALRFGVGLLLFFIGMAGVYGNYVRTGRNRSLKEDNKLLKEGNKQLQDIISRSGDDVFETWKNILLRIHRELGLPDSFRTSLYKFSKDQKKFYMIGRYAAIGKYGQRANRFYPVDEGCIGHAWSNPSGEAFVDDLPSPTHADYVLRQRNEWKITERVVREMRMQCRSIYAFALQDSRGSDRIAVVVFESLDDAGHNVATLRDAVRGKVGPELSTMLETMSFIQPDPSLAKQAGF